MRTSVLHSAEGRGGNRKFQGFFDPIWLSEESGKMKGQDVRVGLGSEPTLCSLLFGDCAASWFYLLSEFIHASCYQPSELISHA